MGHIKSTNLVILNNRQDRAQELSPVIPFTDFETIRVGDKVDFSKLVCAEDVELFATVSGDQNPLHTSEEFASRTRFGRRVVHGMLLGSYVSALVGLHCPG